VSRSPLSISFHSPQQRRLVHCTPSSPTLLQCCPWSTSVAHLLPQRETSSHRARIKDSPDPFNRPCFLFRLKTQPTFSVVMFVRVPVSVERYVFIFFFACFGAPSCFSLQFPHGLGTPRSEVTCRTLFFLIFSSDKRPGPVYFFQLHVTRAEFFSDPYLFPPS